MIKVGIGTLMTHGWLGPFVSQNFYGDLVEETVPKFKEDQICFCIFNIVIPEEK
jgi:hypothetical protein